MGLGSDMCGKTLVDDGKSLGREDRDIYARIIDVRICEEIVEP
jgi:hypothetical protein